MAVCMDWNNAYKTGNFTMWENETPSAELVAMVAIQGEPHGKKALDIGCGAGREALFLAQVGYAVVGLDMSEEALQIAATRSAKTGIDVDWRQGDALHIPVDSNSMDFVNDRGCFHIITDLKDREKYAAEVTRVLKPGGRFLLRGCGKQLDTSFFNEEELKEFESNAPVFVPMTSEVVNRFFPEDIYFNSGVFPIMMGGLGKQIPGNLVYLTKHIE